MRDDSEPVLAEPIEHGRQVGTIPVCRVVVKIRADNLDAMARQLLARRQIERLRVRPFEINPRTGFALFGDPADQSLWIGEMFDQVRREERVEPSPREIRELPVEIDHLPAGIQGVVLALAEIDPVEVEVGARRPAPAAPMRQSSVAGAEIEQVGGPGQRFDKAEARMEFPEQFQQRVIVEIDPGLDRGELLQELCEIAAPLNRHAR